MFWDVFGQQGHPVRATVAEMGPLLLARMLELNDTQEGVLTVAFKLADDEGLLLLDFKDLRAMLGHVGGARRPSCATTYGNVSKATHRHHPARAAGAGAGGRRAVLRRAGAGARRPDAGHARTAAARSTCWRPTSWSQRPRLYATFLLWLLTELFEELPEVGDLDKPKLVFFFDEAHLLFRDAPQARWSRRSSRWCG